MTVKKLDATDVRRLIKRASGASRILEATVRELVRAEAWRIVGYTGFAQMWEAETGYPMPSGVRNIVHDEVTDIKGINTRPGRYQNGATAAEVADDIGLHTVLNSNGGRTNTTVHALNKQKLSGVPVSERGQRARGTNRRIGSTADDMVQVGFLLKRRDVDAITKYAQSERIPNAEAYRDAVILFLDKVAPTRARKTQSKR